MADRTNLTVAPTTEIRLDKFVYDPGGASGNVVVIATLGAFRFITGVQPHENYEIKTPVATLGVRGTEFIALVQRDGAEIQLNSGEVIVTTISGNVVPMNVPQTVLTVDSQGNTQGPTPVSQPLVNFADLGPPMTNTALSDAAAAFAAVTGDTTIGAAGGGGGGGETGTGGGGGGIGEGTLGGGVPLNPNNATVTESDNFPPPTIATTSTPLESVSPSRSLEPLNLLARALETTIDCNRPQNVQYRLPQDSFRSEPQLTPDRFFLDFPGDDGRRSVHK